MSFIQALHLFLQLVGLGPYVEKYFRKNKAAEEIEDAFENGSDADLNDIFRK